MIGAIAVAARIGAVTGRTAILPPIGPAIGTAFYIAIPLPSGTVFGLAVCPAFRPVATLCAGGAVARKIARTPVAALRALALLRSVAAVRVGTARTATPLIALRILTAVLARLAALTTVAVAIGALRFSGGDFGCGDRLDRHGKGHRHGQRTGATGR